MMRTCTGNVFLIETTRVGVFKSTGVYIHHHVRCVPILCDLAGGRKTETR